MPDPQESKDLAAVFEEYSVDRTYAYPASDKRGHTDEVRIKIPPFLKTALASLVDVPGTEYQFITDFMRDAIYHRVHYWMGRLASDTPGELSMSTVQARVATRNRRLEGAEDTVNELEDQYRRRIYDPADLLADVMAARMALPAGSAELARRLDVLISEIEREPTP